MTEVEKPRTSGKETIYTRSRYCARCDARLKWDCTCPTHLHMAWMRKNVFHSGKRYKGKKAWKKVHEVKFKGDLK